jgi:hypothetical protein
VAAGDAFSAAERHEIDKAIRDAETMCRYEFSVYVGEGRADLVRALKAQAFDAAG